MCSRFTPLLHSSIRWSACLSLLVLSQSAPIVRAADAKVDYLKQIKPLLETKCYACHGALKQEGGLRLETLALMLQGGDTGPVLQPGNDAGSMILERITADTDSRMPPADEGAALKSEEIELLRSWIQQGAIAPDEAVPESPSDHWAFQKIQRPIVEGAAANPVDALLEAARRQNNLKTQPLAQRSLRIRRLYLDLIGLPPTFEQLQDQRPWLEIVDELLASPHHGERWGRHWMDVWRYSDWYGLGAQLRNSQKHMWHWRDWIVNSLNADKGYDRMIQEMLAGDELAPDDPEVVAGTGFLARNYYLFNRTTWLDSTIEHTSKAFLGLTMNCAKCHDHKYDPLSHVDYYNFRAFFEPHQVRLDPVPGETDFEKNGLPRVFDDHADQKTFLHRKGDPSNPDETIAIQPQVPSILAGFQPKIEPVPLPPTAYAPAVRDYVQHDLLTAAQAEIDAAQKKLAEAEKRLSDLPPATASPAKADPPEFLFADNFQKPNPEVWEIVGEGWEYRDGALHQTKATRDAEFVRLRQPLPEDFEVTCEFTTTGGTTYKSTTFRFDESQDRSYANFVYTSAYAAGSKVQVALTRDGAHTYPSEGQVAHPVKVGDRQRLRFAVRDRLCNVWLNDKFLIAYQFPDRQPKGRLSLSGFDATVAWHSINIRSLPQDVALTAAKNATTASPQDAAAAVKIAAASLHASQASLKSLQARLAADAAVHQPELSTEERRQRIAEAARCEAEAELAVAEHELLTVATDAAKVKAARQKIAAAQEKRKAADSDKATYTSIRASRKALETPAHKESDYAPVYPTTSTGRRLSLARWMTSPENPLTARVAVNHVWMRHFGEPLVENVFDFGLRTERPLHADLLDYLALEFMESGWSFKHLHRLIVTSEAWQLESSTADADPHTLAADPNNRFYWRMNTRRMESQVVRDSLLHLAETLDTSLGGPSVDVGNNSRRRSLYFKHSRDDHDKFLTMFDDADLLQCYRRSESIVPQQALALANSQLSISMATTIAQEISERLESSDTEQFVSTAIETVLGRPSTAAEREACLQFCDQLQQLLTQEATVAESDLTARIRSRLIHSLLNHNDFVSIR